MSRSSVLVLLGVLTIFAPFSGLPSAMRTLLAAIFGGCVLGIGVAMRTREQRIRGPALPDAASESPHSVSAV